MLENFEPILTWSHERVFAGKAQNIILLVEWNGISTEEQSQIRSYKLVAREIELRIWLEPHVTFKRCYGGEANLEEGGTLLFKLGKIHAGQRKFIALQFTISALTAGKYEAVWLQWKYKRPSVERVRELPVKKLKLEYTHHTRILGDSSSFHVEKHLEILKTAEIVEEATVLRADGYLNQACDRLTRHADKLLLLATRSGDILLLKEAESLYKQIELEFQERSRALSKQ